MDSLTRKSAVGLIQMEIIMPVLIFVSAGTIRYWQGWVFLILFSLSIIGITGYFLKYDPHLLAGRVVAGPRAERELIQKIIQSFAAVFFVATLVLPGLDYRYGWSQVPVPIVLLGDVLLVLSFAMIFVVFMENSYAVSTVKVEPGQPVISTGLYGLIRHPMYSAALILFVATPLALGSLSGLILLIPLCLILAVRLIEEERYLSVNLPGYDAYRQQVTYRLMPFVW